MGEPRRGRRRRLVHRVSAGEAGQTLVDGLSSWVPSVTGEAVSRARVRALVVAGAVRVDGITRRTPGRLLRTGERIDAALDPAALRSWPARDEPFALTRAAILHRDEWLIAVDKPAGLPAHPTADPARPSLVVAVQEYLRRTGSPDYLAVHQRLDRDTSGVVLFATAVEANAGLAAAFERRRVEKTYLALVRPVRGRGPEPGRALVVDEPLSTQADGRVRVGGAGARPAATALVVRRRSGELLLVEAHPATGRKHQVRVHLAHAGLPIVGDPLYGQRERAPRLMLHAARLLLDHPISGRRLLIESPLPADFALLLARAGPAQSRDRR